MSRSIVCSDSADCKNLDELIAEIKRYEGLDANLSLFTDYNTNKKREPIYRLSAQWKEER